MTPPTLAVFTKNRLNPAYDAARLAADRVAAESGARTIHYVPDTPDDVGEQKALVTEALAARPAGVVFNPTDDRQMAEDLARFAAAGIPVAVFINRMTGPALTFVGSDDVAIGHGVAKALIDGLGGKGRIVALDGTPTAPTARDRGKGLRQAVAEHPGIELLAARVGYLQRAPAREAMAELLAAHPRDRRRMDRQRHDGVRRGRCPRGRWPARQVVGVNGLPEAIANIQRGTMLATADFSALNIAAIATRAVLRHLGGQPVPSEIMVPAALIDRGNIEQWTVPMAERPCPAWDEIVR